MELFVFSFQHVDEENGYLCGYLKIKGLTDEYPTLTTFFDGEIISEKHPFLTRKWDADEEVDKKHWGKFNAFHQYAKTFNSDTFDYEALKKTNHVFMRWKEHFLVPGKPLWVLLIAYALKYTKCTYQIQIDSLIFNFTFLIQITQLKIFLVLHSLGFITFALLNLNQPLKDFITIEAQNGKH